MNRKQRGEKFLPTTSTDSYPSTTGAIFLCQDYPLSVQSTLLSDEYIFLTKVTRSAILLQRPKPMAASEPPITILDATRKINHHLLRSCALLANNEPDQALEEATYALYLAEARKIYHLQSKSQLYRGLCLMELERWEEASAAFTRAANMREWSGRVAELKIEAERKIAEVEEGRERKGMQIERR